MPHRMSGSHLSPSSTLFWMSVNRDRYCRAVEHFGRVVSAADPSQWDSPSPCTEWSARAVVGHVVATQHAIVATIGDRRAPMNPMKDPGRHAGDDPVAAWKSARDALLAAVTAPDVLERIVTTWRGEVTVDDMLGYNVADPTVHAWDLARAVGGDDRLDPDLVAASLALYEPIIATMRAPNIFGEAMVVDPDASPQDRLLALVGRSPR